MRFLSAWAAAPVPRLFWLGILLANHFGNLDWTAQQILEEACRREGHPDNVAACYLGGMTASSITRKTA